VAAIVTSPKIAIQTVGYSSFCPDFDLHRDSISNKKVILSFVLTQKKQKIKSRQMLCRRDGQRTVRLRLFLGFLPGPK
jgi:hypothetical protein